MNPKKQATPIACAQEVFAIVRNPTPATKKAAAR
jgi:hypothetical protein